MFDHGDGTVEVEDGGDGHRGDTGPGPDEGGLALDVQADDLWSGGEVEADPDCVIPAVAVEPEVISQGPTAGAGCSPGLAGWVQSRLNRTGTSAHAFSPGSSTTPTPYGRAARSRSSYRSRAIVIGGLLTLAASGCS